MWDSWERKASLQSKSVTYLLYVLAQVNEVGGLWDEVEVGGDEGVDGTHVGQWQAAAAHRTLLQVTQV